MDSRSRTDEHERLTVIGDGRHQGMTWTLPDGTFVLGRAPDVDLRVDEPTVSRHHARLERAGRRTVLTDLGSTSGTTVNGRSVRGAVEVRPGDEIGIATVRMMLGPPIAATAAVPQTGPPGHASYTVGRQDAQQLNNVGGNQYNQYLQTVHAERDSFLRDIAATRTRARILVWTGILLFVTGFGAFAAMVIQFIAGVPEVGSDPSNAENAFEEAWGTELGGVPIGFIGWAVGALGVIVAAIGIGLHVIATARRRRVARDFTPMPPPGPYPNHPPTTGSTS